MNIEHLANVMSPSEWALLRVLVELRTSPIAERAFPDHNRLLWVDPEEARELLDEQAMFGLMRRHIVRSEDGEISGRLAVGFIFLPEDGWDTSVDRQWWPVVGDKIRSLKTNKTDTVAEVDDMDRVRLVDEQGRSRWVHTSTYMRRRRSTGYVCSC